MRERVLRATVACAGRVGLSRITVEDVAREAGVSRASIYRYFPGGREQLVDEAVTWEVGQFLVRLGEAVDQEDGFEARLTRGLVFGHRAIEEHDVLQKLLATEPGRLLPQLRTATPMLMAAISHFLRAGLARERVRPGVNRRQAADYLTRMVLSFFGTAGGWDLADEEQVRTLVRTQLVAGILADPAER